MTKLTSDILNDTNHNNEKEIVKSSKSNFFYSFSLLSKDCLLYTSPSPRD